MKFTVDLDKKEITLVGVYTFDDIGKLRAAIPNEWWGFAITQDNTPFWNGDIFPQHHPPTLTDHFIYTRGYRPYAPPFKVTCTDGFVDLI